MKHTERMFLVPEDLYRNLFTQYQTPHDGSALGMVHSKIQQLSQPSNKLNDDERAIQYDQEYKRFNKLQKEQEEKPLNVRLQNLKEIAENLPQKPEISKTKIILKKSKSHKRFPRKSKSERHESFPSEDEFEDAESEEKFIPGSSQKNFPTQRQIAMEYIENNQQLLGVNRMGQILHSTNPNTPAAPIKTSNISSIVDHILINEGVRRRPLPTGYEKFMERLNTHPQLIKILGIKSQQRHQSGSGQMMLFKKVYNKPKESFKFKPTLWSISSKI
jgi:hypothetical protein